MNRRGLLIAAAVAAGVGLLAYGTWCCLGWMAGRKSQAAYASLWASQTWPKILGLSQDQRSQIAPLEKTLKKDMDGLQVELTQNQIALCRAMMSQAKPDSAVLRRTLNHIADIQRQREGKTLDYLLGLRKILSPDQQKRLFTTMMRDICQGCRMATGSKKDYCGLCNLK